MSELVVVGKVIDKMFKTVESTGQRAGDLILEVDNSYVKKDGEQVTKIDSVPVTFYSKSAEWAEKVNKGDRVSIEFKVGGFSWADKVTGEIRFASKLNGSMIKKLEALPQEDPQAPARPY